MERLRGTARKEVLGAALLYLAVAVAWAPAAALGSGVFWFHDLRHHHYAWRVWAAAEWLAGHVPAWCPGAGNGFPLMADAQTGAFYPPTMLLFMLLPAPLALDWAVLGHAVWAALGTFLLARALGTSRAAAWLSGLAFAWSGFFVSHTLYLGMQNALAWMPFTLWAAIRACAAPREGRLLAARHWLLVALGLWMMAVAGHPQAGVYGWILVAIVVLVKLGADWRHPRALFGFGLALLAAAALASPQIAATLELTRFSMREGGVSSGFAGIGSLPPQELVNAVLPRFFGIDRPADMLESYTHRGTGYWGMGETHWEMCFYLGIPVVVLASLGAFSKKGRLWSILAAASVILMLGRFTPLWDIVRHLPGLSYFRFPVRFAMWLTLAVDLLFAFGLDSVLARVSGRGTGMDAAVLSERRFRRWFSAVAFLTVIGASGLALGHFVLDVEEPELRARLSAHFLVDAQAGQEQERPLLAASMATPEPEDPAAVPAKVQRILDDLRQDTAPWSPRVLWPVGQVAALLTTLAFALRRPGPRRKAVFLVVTSVMIAADLFWLALDYHALVPRALVEKRPEFLDHLEGSPQDWRVTVVDRRVDPALDVELASASLGLAWGLQDVFVPTPMLLARNDALLGLAGLDLGADKGHVKVERLLRHLGVSRLLGLRYLLSTWEIDDPRLVRLMDFPVRLYRDDGALPLAFLPGCVRQVSSTEAAFEAMQTLDPAREAIVEPPFEPLARAALLCDGSSAGSATVLHHDARTWQVDVQALRDAMLVVAETDFPGWKAAVDGVDEPILAADFIFRGIPVTEGRHRVTLRYTPAWLRPSLVASLSSLALCLLSWVLSRPKRPRLTPTSS
jgi:hypothetical protein